MGTGYTRNDASNNIANGNVIDAADLDGEFDAIESAFGTGGHSHDGTSAEGGAITNLGPSQEFKGDGSSLFPKADATYDLGKSTASFDVAYVESINLGGTGITSTAAEINYTDGVTSAIQTQLDGKQAADANIVSDANYVATDQNFTDADHTKLNGIATSATNTAAPAISTNGSTPSLASGITAAEVRSLIGAGTSSSNNATHTGEVTGSGALTVADNVIDAGNLKVTGNGTTSQFLRSDGDGTFTWATPSDNNTVYTHPTHPGDDFSIDTGVMSGATVISDLDINITTNTEGHVTDANAAVSTRNITLANLGYTGATNANNYSHPTFNGDDFSIDTGHLSGATVIDDLDINITTDGNGHVTDANATVGTRNLTLANLGYTGATNANNYVHPTSAGNKHIPSGGSSGQMLQYSSSGTAVWADAAGGSGVSATMLFDHKGTFTWTTPSACKVMIQAVGAGGSGGTVVSQASSSTNASAIAQGGSGGGYARSIVNLAANTTITMTIGEGGDGRVNGIAWNNNTVYALAGNDGGTTTVTASGLTTMTANGGDGGQASGNSSGFTHPAFSTASAGGTASGGTEANITGTAALDLSSATTLGTKTHLFLPPASFHSGFDNSRGLPTLATVVAATSDSDPIRYRHFGSHIEQSWINYTRGNYFGTALNSHVRGNMPRMTGSEDHTTDGTADDGYYGTRVPGASFTQKGGTENQGLNANNVQPGPATYGTGSGGGIHCANGFTGSKTARSADGGDGFVIITVLDI